MNGILIVDKPLGWTSFDVIAKLRGALHTRKIGHSGTLDPLATGVLPLFVGGAVKAVDLPQNHRKSNIIRKICGDRPRTVNLEWPILRSHQGGPELHCGPGKERRQDQQDVQDSVIAS